MAKFRVLFFLLTLVIVGGIGLVLSYYAKGYRFDFSSFKFLPNGILVIKSNPDGAQVFINGELTTATNATINLPPNTYDISVRKEGYSQWNKRLVIEKEVVTEADAHLFRVVPSLSSVTFSGVTSALPSPDFTKIAYIVPVGQNGQDLSGLWVMETVNFPLGFSREPRRITDGDLREALFKWSPDGREILLQTTLGSYLLDIGSFTPQAARVNILAQSQTILSDWALEEKKRLEAKLNPLPDELEDILRRKADFFVFAPDESKILYITHGEATIADTIIKPIPGASTQKQERELKAGSTYVYDLKEDRNFLIDEDASTLSIKTWEESEAPRRLFWFASSRHLALAEESKITIMDLDGTNRQVVYTGSYVSPNAFAAPSIDRLLVLTNLGANASPSNLYSLSLK
ncbi:PEGA domain-containing protein [Candidatus Woesebacteria bacterium]|nr:PEGA domain-containing protein [Candidatus Woesebacteria bacterium]